MPYHKFWSIRSKVVFNWYVEFVKPLVEHWKRSVATHHYARAMYALQLQMKVGLLD